MAKKLIDSYKVIADNVPASVSIWSDDKENVPVYDIQFPSFREGTEAMLASLSETLAEKSPLEITEVIDAHKAEIMKKQFLEDSAALIKEELPQLSEGKAKILAGTLLHRMYGLGFVEII